MDLIIQNQNERYFGFKRIFDAVASGSSPRSIAPLAVLVALAACVDVGPPIIFWQQRIGRGGERFVLYKFRTYRAPFEANGRPIERDSRLSNLGQFIRRTRLDEIPQLFNILRGDMSLIGPRPLLPIDQPRDPSTRLRVRPGVTGWAQVNGGTLVSPEEKDALDTWYICHASVFLDLRILCRTGT